MYLVEKKIGKFKVMQRTEYSKINILNENDENINDTILGKTMLRDYEMQEKAPECCFEIDNDEIVDFPLKRTIENIFIPDSINSIGNYSFENSRFIRIYIPETVKHIGKALFRNCENLEEVEFPKDAEISFGWEMFENCIALKTVRLPNNITEISKNMFNNCISIKNIDLSEDIRIISNGAFKGCEKLERIVLPDSIKEIYNYAFEGCKALKEINIPRDLKNLGVGVFRNTNINTLIINHDITGDGFDYKDGLFSSACIEKLVINNTVKIINPDFFKDIKDTIIEISYHGTQTDLENFKNNNKNLFKLLKLAKINVTTNSLENMINSDKDNINHSNIESENERT